MIVQEPWRGEWDGASWKRPFRGKRISVCPAQPSLASDASQESKTRISPSPFPPPNPRRPWHSKPHNYRVRMRCYWLVAWEKYPTSSPPLSPLNLSAPHHFNFPFYGPPISDKNEHPQATGIFESERPLNDVKMQVHLLFAYPSLCSLFYE